MDFPHYQTFLDQEADDLGYGHNIHVRKSGNIGLTNPFLLTQECSKSGQNDKLGMGQINRSQFVFYQPMPLVVGTDKEQTG